MNDAADAELARMLAELAGRMDQYVACMRELPNVGWTLQGDLLRIAARESYRIEALHLQIDGLLGSTPPCAPPCALAGLVRYISSRPRSAEVLIADGQVRAALLEDPMARARAQEWLSRASRYSDAGRRAQTVACIANVLARLPAE